MRSGKSLSGGATRAAGLALMGALALAVALLGAAGTAQAAPTRAATRAASASRPAENAAYARVAVVRVLTTYYGATARAGLIPALNQCAGTGVIVGTTGSNLNSYNYVLLPTALVNPINPCQGVKTTFTQFNGSAQSWGIVKIQVLLDAAYTGTSAQRMGSVAFTIDPSQIRTTGTDSGPKLLALPLSIPSGAPTHDLPVLQTPQASDAPPDPSAATFIDLTGQDGAPLNRDSLLKSENATMLYPVAFPASQVFTQAAPAATATAAPTATGTPPAKPTATPKLAPTATPQPTTLASQLSLGAIEVDGSGRLIGMIGPDNQGNHILYDVRAINAAIGGVTGKSGPLMTQWSQGLTDFYASPPKYGSAHTAFAQLRSTYPDFAGVQPFEDAAAQQSSDIPSLTGSQTSPAPQTSPEATGSGKAPLALLGGAAVAVLLGLIGVAAMFVRQRRGRGVAAPALSRADEAMLDLLPPDMALDEVPDQPTRPMSTAVAPPLSPAGAPAVPAVPAPRVAIDELATAHVSVIPRMTAAPRALSILTPRSAGLTDPGVKRASEPNQDNIFALEGIRAEVGRLQPFGLFIVADGMGGHLNGQLASRLAIETIARSVVRTLTAAQRVDSTAPRDLLIESVRSAHQEIQRRNRENAGDMGSTVTAALVVDDHAYIINVGDSRTYLLNPDTGLKQITTDHSIVASLAASGVIKPEDIYIHPRRNQIYRSLGGEDDRIEVDAFEQDLQAGDKLLLCSDGLWEMVRDPQIANILRGAANPAQAVELLVREANANGGEDNIGVVVVRMIEGLPPGAEPGMRMVVGPGDTGGAGGE